MLQEFNFLDDIQKRVEYYLRLHKKTDWIFKWSNGKKVFCKAYYGTKIFKMSKPLCVANYQNFNLIEDIILHELAIILSKDRGAKGYTNIWRQTCLKLGCSPIVYYVPNNINTPLGNYKYKCPHCGKISNYYHKLKQKRACGKCCKINNNNKYTEKFELKLIKGE